MPLIAILVSFIILSFIDLPENLQKKMLPVTPSWVSSLKIHLGLDLQGGTQLDYKIDLSKVPETDRKVITDGVREVITRRVNKLGVSEPNIYLSEIANEHHIVVELAGIKDIEEAKEVVGKTIQLEFKEERTEAEPEEKESIKSKAISALLDIRRNGKNFTEVGKTLAEQDPGKITFTEDQVFVFGEAYGDNVHETVKKMKPGDVWSQPIETSGIAFVDEDGVARPVEGLTLIKLFEKGEKEREVPHEKEVHARHILISYNGAEGAQANRTEEEARLLAQELVGRAHANENFEDLAKEFSDDASNKAKGGDLGFFKYGTMVREFSDTAFRLQKGEISSAVRTQFGFHIIKVEDIKEAFTEKKTEPQYRSARIVFSTAFDPWKETGLTGQHFVHADVEFNPNIAYQPYVSIKFNDEGAEFFANITERNVGKQVAIFVGGNLISAPRVNEKIAGGQAQITGNFTVEEATALARDLNTGAIPAPILLSGQYSIGASLGAETLKQSLIAGIIGLILVTLYMVIYYRLPGLISVGGLLMYTTLLIFSIKIALPLPVAIGVAFIIYAVLVNHILKSEESGLEKTIAFILATVVLFFFSFVFATPVVLTLAGVAGIILSIGMAVDANVLIFERTKEEIRAGRTLEQAVDIGFERAWSSIRDSNFSSLITCAILFYFGSSIIRGFAFNLALGILISMFTAITITRQLLKAVIKTKFGEKISLFAPTKKRERAVWRIIQKRPLWYAFSGTLIGLTIIFSVVFGIRTGIDFTGGTLMQLSFEKQIATENIQEALNEVDKEKFANSVIVKESETGVVIRTKHIENSEHDIFLALLKEKFGNVEESRFTTIGPTIGDTMKQKALIAIVIAGISIIVYIAFAFRRIPRELSPWRFGIAAVVALIHDITITFGVFLLVGKLFGVEIDALFITALLTVMGFSVHDTIVVFDRIRENLKFRKRDETFEETANISLNQTMARSINTSLTTFLTLLMLFIFGGASITWFAFALLVGITIGTYSSVAIATPLLVSWKNWQERKR